MWTKAHTVITALIWFRQLIPNRSQNWWNNAQIQVLPVLVSFIFGGNVLPGCSVCCGLIPLGAVAVRTAAPRLSPADWRVGAALLSAHHLAPGRLCLGKRLLPGLNYGENNPGHTEAITAPYKAMCFGLKSHLLPTLWRDSAGLRFSEISLFSPLK